MTTRKKNTKPKRHMRSDKYRKDAANLYNTVAAIKAVKQPGTHTTQTHDWRNKIGVKESRPDEQILLMDESAKLTREMAEKNEKHEFLQLAGLSSTSQVQHYCFLQC